MSGAELSLTYEPDTDGTGEIFATVRSGGFSGKGSAWFDRTNVKETFVAELRPFPLTATPLIEGGFWNKDKGGMLDQCHLRIAVTSYNSCGALLVRVDLATASWQTPDVDRQQTVTVRFLAEYAAIAKFADDFERVLDGAKDQAVLAGTTT